MAKVAIYHIDLPLKRLVLGLKTRSIGILKLTDDRSRVGYGEVSPLPGFSKNFIPSLKWGMACAIKMISQAPARIVRINGLITENANALEEAKTFDAQGYTHIKIKTNHGITPHILKQIVSQTHLMLRLDGNQKLTFNEAVDLAQAIPSDRFDYFEDPFIHNQENYRRLCQLQIPFAVDSVEDIPMSKSHIIKPTLVGHAPENAILSSAYESALGIAHIAHAANLNKVHGLDTLDIFAEPLFAITKKNGTLLIPSMEEIKQHLDRLTNSLSPALEF